MSYLSCEDLSLSSFHREADILAAWTQNAAPWTDVVRRREIDSRRLVTDDAVLQVIAAHKPASVLDIGCGEGWLARAMADLGCPITGVDAVPELIERARQAGGGIFHVASFQDIVAAKLAVTADLSVCNFSLLGENSVEELLVALPRLQGGRGALVIQTVHPLMACGEGQPYVSGWREESWSGFAAEFRAPSPWYFRTLQDWIALLGRTGWQLTQLHEPLHPVSGKPASLIMAAGVTVACDRGES